MHICRAHSPQCEQTALANAAMMRYARGDDRAFDELYRLLSPRLFRLCRFLAGSGEAEELLQETFLKMHRARHSFVNDGSVIAWSFAIARTTHIDRCRRRKRRPEATLDLGALEGRAAAQDESVEASSDQRALERQLARLTESLRSAYVLVKLEELSCADAGAVLGISVSAVKQRVHRAALELRAGFAHTGSR